ncbi:unnamed protein product [Paramecium pentaurelia]|uniref:Uncharacterized protein n=1 Tax=Paramecium pentaurelia TaxID=43138 RepID=A0A8S1SBX6_9CILI|nr:unnamed protein product [Paramecium pentaurelia]
MSNFKRNDNSKKEDPYKAYFGHPELDALLGNSLLKGQIIFIEQDTPTTIYKQFLRYCIGNSFHKNHVSIIFDQFSEQWSKIIPKKQVESSQQQEEKELQHKIAWRYNQMQQQFTIKNIDSSIFYLDLSKSETEQAVENHLKLNNYDEINNLQQFLQIITKQYQKSLKSSTDSTMKKLIIHDFWDKIPYNQQELNQFLYSLKVLIRSSYLLCIITLPERRTDLMQFCDFYITITQLFGNKEFSDFQGMIKFDKIGWSGSLKQVQLDNDKWGIKITQKQLKIEQLYETAIEDDSEEEQKNKSKIEQF